MATQICCHDVLDLNKCAQQFKSHNIHRNWSNYRNKNQSASSSLQIVGHHLPIYSKCSQLQRPNVQRKYIAAANALTIGLPIKILATSDKIQLVKLKVATNSASDGRVIKMQWAISIFIATNFFPSSCASKFSIACWLLFNENFDAWNFNFSCTSLNDKVNKLN